MTRPRWLLLWLAIVVGLGVWSGLRLRQEGAIRSDLLALLPKESQDGASEAALAHLAQAAGNRAFLLVVAADATASTRAAATTAVSLRASGAFARVVAEMPAPETKNVLAFFKDKGPQLCPRPAPDLSQAFLARSYGTFSTTGTLRLAEDPFGHASSWLVAMPWPQANFRWQDGYLTTPVAGGVAALVILELGADSGRYEAQVASVQAVAATEATLAQQHPSASLRRLGGVFYAEAAQTGARTDTDRIGFGSAVGVVLLMLLVFRSLSMLATGLLSIVAGVAAGTAAVLGIFGEIHLVTLVFGVSLIGEASDYSIQLLSAKLSDDEEGRAGWLERVTPGLCMALGTSLLGYAAMTFMPLPSIRQIAVFALVGLSAAFLTVLLSGPAAARVLRGGRVAGVFGQLAARIRALSARLGRAALWTGIAVFALGLTLAIRIHTDDDVQSLIHRPARLMLEEAEVKRALGADLSGQFLLIHPSAGTDEKCLQTEEDLRAKLLNCRQDGVLEGWTALAEVTPSRARQEESLAAYRAGLQRDRSRLKEAFGDVGFTPSTSFWEPMPAILEPSAFLELNEGTPFRHLRFTHQGKVLHIVTLRGVAKPDELRARLAGLADVTVVDKTWSIGRLLGDVRRQGVWWMSVAFLLALGVLSLRYGLRRSLILLLPTAIGVAWAPVLASACGQPFSVFSLMALILVLGVGVNYSIFLWEGGDRSRAALAGVIASCCTTLLSFGLLAFSSMPALRWLGTTLSFGILVAFLLTPLALIGRTDDR